VTVSRDISKSELLKNLGFGTDSLDTALDLIHSSGLSNARKQRIAVAKRREVAELLRKKLILVCGRGDCQSAAERQAAGRIILRASSQHSCWICHGSANQRAAVDLVDAFGRVGWRRLAVVGGSPNARDELIRLLAGALELRLIDGTRSRNQKAADADLAWADHVVIWGSTQLSHKVSKLYESARRCSTASRRGVQALCMHLVDVANRTFAQGGEVPGG
jgi:hypothetical protein